MFGLHLHPNRALAIPSMGRKRKAEFRIACYAYIFWHIKIDEVMRSKHEWITLLNDLVHPVHKTDWNDSIINLTDLTLKFSSWWFTGLYVYNIYVHLGIILAYHWSFVDFDSIVLIASIVLICKSLWIKASAKWLNVNVCVYIYIYIYIYI